MMMNDKQLMKLTEFLKDNIFKNEDIMFSNAMWEDKLLVTIKGIDYNLCDVIASLHNIIYECVTGERYNYMFHHCNKIGCACDDDIFDTIIRGDEK